MEEELLEVEPKQYVGVGFNYENNYTYSELTNQIEDNSLMPDYKQEEIKLGTERVIFKVFSIIDKFSALVEPNTKGSIIDGDEFRYLKNRGMSIFEDSRTPLQLPTSNSEKSQKMIKNLAEEISNRLEHKLISPLYQRINIHYQFDQARKGNKEMGMPNELKELEDIKKMLQTFGEVNQSEISK